MYHCVPIKQLGGGKLILYPTTVRPTTWTQAGAEKLMPLLRIQPYITSVEWRNGPSGTDLGKCLSQHYRAGYNLSDMCSSMLGLPHYSRTEPWLTVEPKQVAKVIINRSPRWRNDRFPWLRVWNKYRKDAVFIGLPDEHQEFVYSYGNISYYATDDYLQAAEVIAGCTLYVGNQSCCAAIAQGLRKNMVQETLDRKNYLSNCHWERPGMIHGYDENVQLPDL